LRKGGEGREKVKERERKISVAGGEHPGARQASAPKPPRAILNSPEFVRNFSLKTQFFPIFAGSAGLGTSLI